MSKHLDRHIPMAYMLHKGLAVSDVAEHGFVEYFYPKDGLTSENLEFNVEGNSEQLIHPYLTYIRVKGILEGKASKKSTDGKEKTVENGQAEVGIINNFLGSLFESVEVELNNVGVTKADRNYPYISYLDQLLNYGTDAKNTTMQLLGWSTDQAAHMDDMGNGNSGYEERKFFFNDKQEIEMIGRICSPIFMQTKVLPTMVTMRIIMRKGKERFFLMHEEGDFNFKLTEAVLMVQKTNAVPGVREAYLKLMEEGKPSLIHVQNRQVNHISIPQSMTEKTIDNLFLGKIPERVIIGMVETEAYIGNRVKNPFNFQHFDLAEICLYKDGVPYPRPIIKMNVGHGKWAEAYHHFLTSIKASHNRVVPGITPRDYKHGFTLFSYDMSPDQLGSMHPGSNLNMNSNIRLEMKFHKPLPKGITIIIYYEFHGTIEIHRDRQISVDW